MNIKTIFFFFVIACFTTACNNSAQEHTEQQQAWDEIMAVHDEVMPKMAEVNRLTEQLRTRMATLDSSQMAVKTTYLDAITSLERADEGMMNWMAAAQAPETLRGEQKTHADIMRYYSEEKKKVDQVRDSIVTSLERGNQLLQQAPTATPDTTTQQ